MGVLNTVDRDSDDGLPVFLRVVEAFRVVHFDGENQSIRLLQIDAIDESASSMQAMNALGLTLRGPEIT